MTQTPLQYGMLNNELFDIKFFQNLKRSNTFWTLNICDYKNQHFWPNNQNLNHLINQEIYKEIYNS